MLPSRAPACTVARPSVTDTELSLLRSIRMPRVDERPAKQCPRLRATFSAPTRRANAIVAATSAGVEQRTTASARTSSNCAHGGLRTSATSGESRGTTLPSIAASSAASRAIRLSGALDDHQRVALGIAEPEERRDDVAEAADLGVDVDAAIPQLRVVGVDVVGLERDAGVLAARGHVRARRADRDRRLGAGRRDLDPTVAVAERHVRALLEAERLGIELQHPVLVSG